MTYTKRMTLLALMVTQALVLTIIESWIPVPVPVPGVKLGLANIVTLVVLIFFGFGDALVVVFLRTFLASLFTGGPIVFLFSISGGILSTAAMALLYRKMSKTFSIVGISIAGAIMHNVGQLVAASIVMRELSVLAYLPVLLASGIIMGCFVGICANFLSNALRKTRIFM